MASKPVINIDPELGESIVLQRVDATTLLPVDGYPIIEIALPDAAAVMAAAAAAGVPTLHIKLRVIIDCGDDGTEGWRLVMCSERVPGAPP